MNVFTIRIYNLLYFCVAICAIVTALWIITEGTWYGSRLIYSRKCADDLEPVRRPLAKDNPKSRTDDIEKWGQVLQARRSQMLSSCSEFPSTKNLNRHNVNMKVFLYDNHTNSMYCAVTKVGSSYWKRIFYVMANKLNVSPMSIRSIDIHSMLTQLQLDIAPLAQRQQYFNHAIKFMFTRDPYHRVFSAYCDKLFVYSPETRKISHDILRRLRNRYENNGTQTVNITTPQPLKFNITFSEALLYATRAGVFRGVELDKHFLPVSNICWPCSVNYDFIGKIETIEEDTAFILRFLNSSKILESMQDKSRSDEEGILEDVVLRTFLMIRSLYLGGRAKDIALRRLWKTFHFRGLISDRIPYPLTVNESARAYTAQLVDIALRSHHASGERSERLKQQKKYYFQAYRSVPLSVLKTFSKSIEKDCKIFGYDCEPADIFLGRSEGDEENNIFSDDTFLYR